MNASDIDVVLNLTIPAAHYEVSLSAIRSGKYAYSEKPLSTSLEDGRKLLAAADHMGLRVGAAPDIFWGLAFNALSLSLVKDKSVTLYRPSAVL